MTQKRVRNKKIETDHKYAIHHTSALNPSKIQEHTEIVLNTGMEDEEKEEFHLKSALTNQDSNIPVPRIEQLSTVRSKKGKYTHKRSKDYIKYYNDVENKYILSDEDLEFMDNNNISEGQFYNMVDVVREENEKLNVHELEIKTPDVLWNYVQNRLLLLHDHGEFNSYACFRKRIIKSARKSRKVEISVTEKLKRMWSEINSIEKMVNTTKNVFRLENERFELNTKIYAQGVGMLWNKKIRKRMIHKLIGIKKKSVELPFYKKYAFDDLYNDRRKINEYKFLVKQSKLTDEDIENDIAIFNNI